MTAQDYCTGLKRIINWIQKFPKQWKVKINVKEIKIVMFKEEGKLGNNKKLRLGRNKRKVTKLNI